MSTGERISCRGLGIACAGLQRLRTPLTDGIPYARRVDRAGGQIESTNATRLVRGVEVIGMRSILGPFWCLEDLVLDRCVHALHDHHAIPRAEYAEESREQFPYLAEGFARWSFDEYCRAMAFEPISIEQAEAEMLRQSSRAP